jgi:anti-sigma regulatory factor (Ser/Thr protein kinase)
LYTCTFPDQAGSASKARDFVSRHLAENDLSYLIDDVRLVASELATNAMLHARTPFTVCLEGLVRVVLLTVQDGSPSPPQRVDPTMMDSRGRGMFLVDHASHAWGVTLGPGASKLVWAEFMTQPTPATLTGRPPGELHCRI